MSNRPTIKLSSHLLPLMILILVSCKPAGEPEPGANSQNKDTGGDPEIHAATPSSQSFQPLFDGSSFAGWHGYGGKDASTRWWVNDGVLAIRGLGDGQVDIVTDAEFGNFELLLEWKISPGGNSGIMFNVVDDPQYNTSWKTGPELQILDNEGHADSGSKHRAGDLYDLISSKVEMSKPAGEWNETRLRVENGLVQHWLNGVLIIEVQMWNEAWNEMVAGSKFASMPGFGKYFSGRIALQDHGDVVAFRNIRIREL